MPKTVGFSFTRLLLLLLVHLIESQSIKNFFFVVCKKPEIIFSSLCVLFNNEETRFSSSLSFHETEHSSTIREF